jgi:hypothetical protein
VHDGITQQSVLFTGLFDQREGSSDGGAILLAAADRRLGLSERLAACIADRRQPGEIAHTVHELLSQRLYVIACGYADCNDAARVARQGRSGLTVRAFCEREWISRWSRHFSPWWTSEHLGCKPGEAKPHDQSNHRSSSNGKTVITEEGVDPQRRKAIRRVRARCADHPRSPRWLPRPNERLPTRPSGDLARHDALG